MPTDRALAAWNHLSDAARTQLMDAALPSPVCPPELSDELANAGFVEEVMVGSEGETQTLSVIREPEVKALIVWKAHEREVAIGEALRRQRIAAQQAGDEIESRRLEQAMWESSETRADLWRLRSHFDAQSP